MVGPLVRRRRDPNRRGRGPGVYYHRGHGYYSKYSETRDILKFEGRRAKRSYGKARHRHKGDKRFVRIGRRRGWK